MGESMQMIEKLEWKRFFRRNPLNPLKSCSVVLPGSILPKGKIIRRRINSLTIYLVYVLPESVLIGIVAIPLAHSVLRPCCFHKQMKKIKILKALNCNSWKIKP